MAKYRKKILTEAVQWFKPGDAPAWATHAVREHPETIKSNGAIVPIHFEIDTREGTLKGISGDWLAIGPEGEVYPIGNTIFQKTYELAAEPQEQSNKPILGPAFYND